MFRQAEFRSHKRKKKGVHVRFPSLHPVRRTHQSGSYTQMIPLCSWQLYRVARVPLPARRTHMQAVETAEVSAGVLFPCQNWRGQRPRVFCSYPGQWALVVVSVDMSQKLQGARRASKRTLSGVFALFPCSTGACL